MKDKRREEDEEEEEEEEEEEKKLTVMNWELSGSQEPTRAAVWITASQPSQALMRAGASWISQLAISTSGGSSLVTLFARTVTRTV